MPKINLHNTDLPVARDHLRVKLGHAFEASASGPLAIVAIIALAAGCLVAKAAGWA